jgi:hypothetical protein
MSVEKLPLHGVLSPPALDGRLILIAWCLSHCAYRILGTRVPLAGRISISIQSGSIWHPRTRLARLIPRGRQLIFCQICTDPDLDLIDGQSKLLCLLRILGRWVVPDTDLVFIGHWESWFEEQVRCLHVIIEIGLGATVHH